MHTTVLTNKELGSEEYPLGIPLACPTTKMDPVGEKPRGSHL